MCEIHGLTLFPSILHTVDALFKEVRLLTVSTNSTLDLRFEFNSSSGDSAQAFILNEVVQIRISNKFFEGSFLLGNGSFTFVVKPRFFGF